VKRWFTLAALAGAALTLALLGARATTAHGAGTFTACLVTDIGGLNDKSFNHDAYLGLLQAEKQLHINGRVIQSKSSADYIPNLQSCVRQGAGITIAVGFLMTDAIDAVGSSYPQDKFAIVDVDVASLKHKPKSVLGLIFKEQEAGYLVGYGAGLWAKQQGAKAVGSVGGIKIPPVDRYIAGFQYGAKKADPGLTTLNDYSQDFVAQNKCKEKALNQIAQGSVVEFQVAGQCGLGVLDAAHEKNVFGIGADARQRRRRAVGAGARAAPGPEDGGDRPPRGRRRPRLQQPAPGDRRVRRVPVRRPGRPEAQELRGRDPQGVAAREDPDAAAAHHEPPRR
jgi:basic membrane protein A